jgi:hypothetical protein
MSHKAADLTRLVSGRASVQIRHPAPALRGNFHAPFSLPPRPYLSGATPRPRARSKIEHRHRLSSCRGPHPSRCCDVPAKRLQHRHRECQPGGETSCRRRDPLERPGRTGAGHCNRGSCARSRDVEPTSMRRPKGGRLLTIEKAMPCASRLRTAARLRSVSALPAVTRCRRHPRRRAKSGS